MHIPDDILIAGAGIGGLTAALTLHGRGFTSTLIDRTDTLQPLGLGINLLPHAVRELHELGLGEALARIAVAPTSICYFEPDGTLLFREPRGLQGGYGWPQYSVHRGELHMLLLDAVRSRLGAESVSTGVRAIGFTDAEREVITHTTTRSAVD
jgi:2-polyprenyl-6-methoxyphenol hydroxylase-like FAD-dependent oxidoreductase